MRKSWHLLIDTCAHVAATIFGAGWGLLRFLLTLGVWSFGAVAALVLGMGYLSGKDEAMTSALSTAQRLALWWLAFFVTRYLLDRAWRRLLVYARERAAR